MVFSDLLSQMKEAGGATPLHNHSFNRPVFGFGREDEKSIFSGFGLQNFAVNLSLYYKVSSCMIYTLTVV